MTGLNTTQCQLFAHLLVVVEAASLTLSWESEIYHTLLRLSLAFCAEFFFALFTRTPFYQLQLEPHHPTSVTDPVFTNAQQLAEIYLSACFR